MIRIEAVVKGEPDTEPFTKLFEFKDEDELIFLNVIEMIKDKLSRNLKLNTQETLLAYSAYLVSEIRSNKPKSEIVDKMPKILTKDNVLIGVPETLREIIFNIKIDNLPEKILQFVEPIPTVDYILVDSKPIEATHCDRS